MQDEIFVELEIYPGYFVSNFGRFRKGDKRILSTPVNSKGYCVFSVYEKGKRVFYQAHRLVAQVFIGSLEGKEVNHKNFDKTDNRVENLEIVTRKENMQHYHSDKRAKKSYQKIAVAKTKPPELKYKRPKKGGHGGVRENSGRKIKADESKRVTVSVCLDPENLEYRKQIGRGWNDLVNGLIGRLRPEYQILAIRDFDTPEWRGSYFLKPQNTLELAIELAIQERENRGGKYGFAIYKNGTEVGILPSMGDFQNYPNYI
jgi:hypothetical protein